MNTTNTTSSCLSSLSQINRAKHLLDTTSLLNLINPLIFGKLYYCFPVWSSMSKENISKLQNTQHYTARIGTCSTCKDDHITPALTELELLIVQSMLIYRDGKLVSKCKRGMASDYLANRFKRSDITCRDT